MGALPKTYISADDYLRQERLAETRSEWIGGEVFAMSGASWNHNLICTNIQASLHTQLRAGPCRVVGSDLRVKVNPTGMYTYPDVVLVCGKPELEDTSLDTLLNPSVIIEVLSPSTESFDRGAKFAHYRHLASLRHYLLVAQDAPYIEHYARQGSHWILTEVSGLTSTLALTDPAVSLNLVDVYDRVELDESSSGHYPRLTSSS